MFVEIRQTVLFCVLYEAQWKRSP